MSIRSLVAGGVLAFAMLITPAAAQFGPITAAIAGWTGLELLDRAEKMIPYAANQAEQTGDALLARAATEADILMRSINLQMSENLDKTIGALNEQTNLAYYRLAETLDSFEAAQTRAYRARDATVIDLAMISGSLPFVDQLTFVERIEGLAQFDDGGDFKLSVSATGLKPGIAGTTASLTLTINGKQISFTREQPANQNTRELFIAHGDLAPLFSHDRIVVLPAEMHLRIERRPWYLVGKKVETVTVPFYLSLFPRKAGTLTVETRRPTYGWVALGERLFDVSESADCGQGRCSGREPVYSKVCNVQGGNVETVGNQRIVGHPRHHCKPRWGPNSCAYPGGWFEVSAVNIEDNGKRGRMDIRHWAERNDYGIYCKIEEYKELEPVTETLTAELFYDQNFEFVVPKTANYWRISGQTVTRRSLNVLKNQPNSDLSLIGVFEEGGGKLRVAYDVNRPALQ